MSSMKKRGAGGKKGKKEFINRHRIYNKHRVTFDAYGTRLNYSSRIRRILESSRLRVSVSQSLFHASRMQIFQLQRPSRKSRCDRVIIRIKLI